MTVKYKVVLYSLGTPSTKTIKRGLTLEEAQAMCRDPETSSRTAKGPRAKQYAHLAPWFFGYTEEVAP